MFTGAEMSRCLIRGIRVLAVDPLGDYRRLADELGGTYLDLGAPGRRASTRSRSPAPRPTVRSPRRSLPSLGSSPRWPAASPATSGRPSIGPSARPTRMRASAPTRRRSTATRRRSPTSSNSSRRSTDGAPLAHRLERWAAGSLAHLFAGGTALPLDRRLLVIGLAALADPEVRAVAQLAALGLLWDAVRRDLAPKLIVVDEAWKVMRQPAGAEFIEELARSARHYHAGLQLATQDIVEFLRSDFGESIVKQSDLRVLLGQTPEGADALARYFDLTRRRAPLARPRPARGRGCCSSGAATWPSRRRSAAASTRCSPRDQPICWQPSTGTRRPTPGDPRGACAPRAARLRLRCLVGVLVTLSSSVGRVGALAGNFAAVAARRSRRIRRRPTSPISRPRTSPCTSEAGGPVRARLGGARGGRAGRDEPRAQRATAVRRTLPAPRARCSSCRRTFAHAAKLAHIAEPDICDPVDAIPAAAAYLRSNGAPEATGSAPSTATTRPTGIRRWSCAGPIRYGYGALRGLAGRGADLPALRADELHGRAAPLLRGHVLRALPRRARHRGAGRDAGPGDGRRAGDPRGPRGGRGGRGR